MGRQLVFETKVPPVCVDWNREAVAVRTVAPMHSRDIQSTTSVSSCTQLFLADPA